MSDVRQLADGRLVYKTEHGFNWLPPIDQWQSGEQQLPYGWELAIDANERGYYINHLNKTSTYREPRRVFQEEAPQPREVTLFRHGENGFGFTVGSEKPVVVRFIRPNVAVSGLLSGDQILAINGVDCTTWPSDRVKLLVKQPPRRERRSSLMTASKRAKLRSKRVRVRFAEGVLVDRSPFYDPILNSDQQRTREKENHHHHQILPNVLKVFTENGQSKAFKYDHSTIVSQVLESLCEKLSIKNAQFFALCTKHIKTMDRNRLTVLDPRDTLVNIASRPGSHSLQCLLRAVFLPLEIEQIFNDDRSTFDYIFGQCVADFCDEQLVPNIDLEKVLRLAALNLHQYGVNNGLVDTEGHVDLKLIEKQNPGFVRFLPKSLLKAFEPKTRQRFLDFAIKQIENRRSLSVEKAKLIFLKTIADLPHYGVKIFRPIYESQESTELLVSAMLGVAVLTKNRPIHQNFPETLVKIEDLGLIRVMKDERHCFTIDLVARGTEKSFIFNLEEKDAQQLVLYLQGYRNSLVRDQIQIHWEVDDELNDSAPNYSSIHWVEPAPWSYADFSSNKNRRRIDFYSLPNEEYEASSKQNLIRAIACNSSMDIDDLSKPTQLENHPKLEPKIANPIKKEKEKRMKQPEKFWPDEERMSSIEDEDQRPKITLPESLKHIENEINDDDSGKESPPSTPTVEKPTEVDKLVPPKPPIRGKTLAEKSKKANLKLKIPTVMALRETSFGMHSPDVAPVDRLKNENIDKINKNQSMAAENRRSVIYFDPDLIDLTNLPPPPTPDLESIGRSLPSSELLIPPTPYKDDFNESDRFNLITQDKSGEQLIEKSLLNLRLNAKDSFQYETDELLRNMIIPPPPTSTDLNEDVIKKFYRTFNEAKKTASES